VLILTGFACERKVEPVRQLSFTPVILDPAPPDRPWYKMLGDLDGDGRLDVVVAGSKGPLVWYHYPDWTKAEIAGGGWDGVNGEVGDMDGDGRADIVMGGVVWFRNPGAADEPWTMTSIESRRIHDIELADLDGDGRLDVIGRDQSAFGDPESGASGHVYLQGGPNAWTQSSFPCPTGEGLGVADLDRDGDPDIAIGGRWYANGGRGGGWDERVFAPDWTEPDAKLAIADFNGDGRLDIAIAPAELSGDRYKLSWFENPARRGEGGWREHVAVPEIETVVHALAAGDFDLDGHVDLAYAEMHQGEDPDEVAVLLNLGGGDSWRKQVLSNDGSHDIVVGDIGADGDLDIVGANHAGDKQALMLWENLRRSGR
jgi:hypothetical protein